MSVNFGINRHVEQSPRRALALLRQTLGLPNFIDGIAAIVSRNPAAELLAVGSPGRTRQLASFRRRSGPARWISPSSMGRAQYRVRIHGCVGAHRWRALREHHPAISNDFHGGTQSTRGHAGTGNGFASFCWAWEVERIRRVIRNSRRPTNICSVGTCRTRGKSSLA